MKVAVSVFRGCVSPVFDWARILLVVEREGGRETSRRETELGSMAPAFRGRRLAELGVETLLCGGISAPVAALVESQGVRVMAGLVGAADAVLDAFFAGRLPDPAFAMPGWRCFGRGMGGGRRRGRRRGRGRGGRGGGRGRGRMSQ